MKIDSAMLKGASTLAVSWHPATMDVDKEDYSPYEFSSRREELMAARETAWLGVYLMSTGRIDVYGKDAVKALNQICVNRDFAKLKIGGSRHGLICNEDGYIVSSGIITRMSEDRFRTYAMLPAMTELLSASGLDVTFENISEYFIQLDGPKSLEILEEAGCCNLHDLKFAQNKTIQIAGREVFVHRLGMSGSLAYEMHGAPEDGDAVYTAILEAGKKYGIKRQGVRTYMSNHTPGGYPNQFGHFTYPDKDGNPIFGMKLSGSASDDKNNYYVTPYDIGWGKLVNFDHEFPGKSALQKLAESQTKVPVTLEWNVSDVVQVFGEEIEGTCVEEDEGIFDFDNQLSEFKRVHADKVMYGDKVIGIASGRVRDYYHHSFISLTFIEEEHAQEGTELFVMWGRPGREQRKIRAKVARFPYYNGEFRNETFDTKNIPCRQ